MTLTVQHSRFLVQATSGELFREYDELISTNGLGLHVTADERLIAALRGQPPMFPMAQVTPASAHEVNI